VNRWWVDALVQEMACPISPSRMMACAVVAGVFVFLNANEVWFPACFEKLKNANNIVRAERGNSIFMAV